MLIAPGRAVFFFHVSMRDNAAAFLQLIFNHRKRARAAEERIDRDNKKCDMKYFMPRYHLICPAVGTFDYVDAETARQKKLSWPGLLKPRPVQSVH